MAVGLLLAWTLVADAPMLYIGIFPLLVVGLIRAYRQVVQERHRPSEAWFELSLVAAARAYHLGRYTVLVWHRNLLDPLGGQDRAPGRVG